MILDPRCPVELSRSALSNMLATSHKWPATEQVKNVANMTTGILYISFSFTPSEKIKQSN